MAGVTSSLAIAMTLLLWRRTMLAFGGEDPLGEAPNESGGDEPDRYRHSRDRLPNEDANWHHEELTRRAARAADFELPAESALAFHADYVDSYLYNPLWWLQGSASLSSPGRRLGVVMSSRHELIKLHFDDLHNPEWVHENWQRTLSGTIAGLVWLGTEYADAAGPGQRQAVVSMAHNLLGCSLHAVQDFYSHSNWIDDAARRGRTYQEVPAAERARLDVWTGTYEGNEAHGRAHHGEFLFACSLLQLLPGVRGFVRLICAPHSPFADSGFCSSFVQCEGEDVVRVTPPADFLEVLPPFIAGAVGQRVWVRKGINLDSRWLAEIGYRERGLRMPGGPAAAFETIYTLAERSSGQWLHRVETAVKAAGFEDFWRAIATTSRLNVAYDSDDATPSYTRDTEPWEDMSQLPYRFITAGPYPTPPDETPDVDAWYLRLTVTTSSEDGAGTDAPIVAIVDDGPDEVRDELDHTMVTDGDGRLRAIPSAVAHDDFQKGSRASYMLGPFDRRPTSLQLENNAPDIGDVVHAIGQAIADVVTEAIQAARDFFVNQEDFVGDDSITFDPLQLNALVPGRRLRYTLDCHRGDPRARRSEGRYLVDGHVMRTGARGTSPDGTLWQEYDVIADGYIVRRESGGPHRNRRSAGGDEPFFVGLAVPQGGDDRPAAWLSQPPAGGIDEGPTWYPLGQRSRIRVPDDYGAITVSVLAFESDSGSPSERERIRDRVLTRFNTAALEPERSLLVTLSEVRRKAWAFARAEMVSFRRGTTVDVVTMRPFAPGTQWLDGGQRLAIPLVEDRHLRVDARLGDPRRTEDEDGAAAGTGLRSRISAGDIDRVKAAVRFDRHDSAVRAATFDVDQLRVLWSVGGGSGGGMPPPTRRDDPVAWDRLQGLEADPDYRSVRLEGYVLPESPDLEDSQLVRPLWSFWSGSRQDNHATTDPRLVALPQLSPDYARYRLEGYVFAPDKPQPPGTVPLTLWWNAEDTDNKTSTASAHVRVEASAHVRVERRPGGGASTTRRYKEVRLEGYVYDAERDQPFGSIPLVSWFSQSRSDHFLTTDPRWVPGAR